MDLFSLIRYYLVILAIFFLYMYNTNTAWYDNKFIFFSATVYVPFLIFTTALLKF
jgi:hypothetical protein